jgi:D-alanyl-D-alanine dipeptidase
MMNEKQIRHTISGKIILVMIVIAGSLLTSSCSLARNASPVPAFCRQLVLVITDSVQDTLGTLMYFERENATSAWTRAGDTIAVAIGRHGLGWGRGLHNDKDRADLPFKKEGDGKSPAGVFTLSAVFGYQPADQMSTIAMPYIHVTDMTECIDDPSSRYYNQFVSRDQIERTGQVDWQSSEKMSKAGIYYELGVVVDHNTDPIKKGAGSCIFLHNWAHPNEKTAGCTAMSPQNMKKIVVWLDKSKHPVLIQLPKRSYLDLKKLWHLPELSKK